MKTRLLVLALIGTILMGLNAQVAWCGDLTVPFSLDSASVLPKGVRNVRVTVLTSSVDNIYGDSGQVESLANKMNKTITFNDLAKSLGPLMDRATFKGYLITNEFDPNAVVGETHGVVNTRVSATVPVVAYGLNERWTLAAAIPVIYSNVNVSTGYTANDAIPEALRTLAKDGKYAKVLENAPKLQNVVNYQLASKGYRVPEDQSKTQIGDVSLVGKYQFYKTEVWTVALQPRLVLPTGKKLDINNVVDVAGGDGQFDLGVGAIVDYALTPSWSTTYAVSYLAQLPTTVARRLPESYSERVSSDIDSSIRMDLGDLMVASVGTRYKLYGWTAGVGASLQYKERDSFRGGRYPRMRYVYLEDETEQNMLSAQGSLSYSTIPLFMRQKFPVPMETAMTYSSGLSGRNVKRNDVAALEMTVFF